MLHMSRVNRSFVLSKRFLNNLTKKILSWTLWTHKDPLSIVCKWTTFILKILQHVPESLECLTRLVTLKLDDNQLEKLPDNLGRMTSLEELYGAENFLTYLPPRCQYPSCWSSRQFTTFWIKIKCSLIIIILVSGGWGGFTLSMWMKMISRWET